MPQGFTDRPREVFRHLVEAFLSSGEPVGSRTLSQRLPQVLSPASIRNVMADLESMGLLYAPHTSAGRIPTEKGLRLFVDGLLEIGELAPDERVAIEARMSGSGQRIEDVLAQATQILAGLSRCAGLMLTAKQDSALKHVEFVAVAPGKALVIMVSEDGQVENRVIETPPGLPPSALQQAGNYLNAKLSGRPLSELRVVVAEEMSANRTQLDELSSLVVAAGLATWAGDTARGGNLIVRGQAKLLADVTQIERLSAIQALFERLETQETMLRLLDLAEESDGVRIFIGAESGLFGNSGVAMVVAPARGDGGRIVGAIGVIGPTRINYGRIIPVVDYTARVIGRLLG